ncbi:NAD-P-binding protein [Trametes cingulata]|nr:NAD-P-binding protein [Trametes cingulata]
MPSSQRPTTWLITGTSRGIGLELVRQLLQSPSNVVVAACRNPEKATALHGLKSSAKGVLHVLRLDTSDFDDIRAFPKQLDPVLGEIRLDYLINNAAILVEDTAFTTDPEVMMRTFRTNVAGPALLSQVCLSYLEKGERRVILNISSTGGSIAKAELVGSRVTSYGASKAALNMLTQKQKVERPDLTVITLCPGWVKTDMGGEGAQLEPEESIAGILKIITSVTPADSGKFFLYDGSEIPW